MLIMQEEENRLWEFFRNYENQGRIEEGVYGKVYKVSNKKTGENFALKMMRDANPGDGISPDKLREIVILRDLDHENILK